VGIISQIIQINCMKYFTNGEKLPVQLQRVMGCLREHLIKNRSLTSNVESMSLAFIVLFKYQPPKKDPELVECFKTSMEVFLKGVKNVWNIVQPCKIFTFSGPSILGGEQMDIINQELVRIGDEMILYWNKAIQDQIFEKPTQNPFSFYGKMKLENTELFYSAQVLRFLNSAGQLDILHKLNQEQLLEFATLMASRLTGKSTSEDFASGLYSSLLYNLKSIEHR
jgi:hypothetical protein